MHIPVLKKEVIKYLNPKLNENFVDCTAGEGGHSLEILKYNGPKGKVLAIEIDKALYKKLKAQALDRLILVNDSYVNLKKIVKELKFKPVNGILFDLGMSGWHLGKSGRGFSFKRDEPLDMRYSVYRTYRRPITTIGRSYYNCYHKGLVGLVADNSLTAKNNSLTAEKIINNCSSKELEKILKEYGEERFAKRIAKKITEERKIKPIKTTFQLVEIIKRAVPLKYQKQKIHPATRTFQALRIAVNDELNNLKSVLPQATEILAPGGRLVIISFHSLEDRLVKNFFKSLSSKEFKILTKKPIRPNEDEIEINPRARSAKLRAIEKKI